MNNLFVINTPLQLLTAYIVANSTAEGDTNQLLLLHPNGYELWDESYCLTKMSKDTTTWQTISVVENWMNRRTKVIQVRREFQYMHDLIAQRGSVDRVYLGSDKRLQNQFIVEMAGNSTYIRLDEGIGSYWDVDRSRVSKLGHSLKIAALRSLGKVKGNMIYNTGGLGHGKAATADYLYKPSLLQRISPQVVEIEHEHIMNVLDKLTADMPPIQELESPDCLLFVGSDFVERKWYSAEEEAALLLQLYHIANHNNLRMVYKPHTSEKKEKLDFYRQQIPGLTVLPLAEPIETLYYRIKNLRYVISYASSGLLFGDCFAKQPLQAIGLLKFFPQSPINPRLGEIMREAGVHIPESLEELSALFSVNTPSNDNN